MSLSPGVAGRTGDAISVGFSANGSATASADSGGLGSGIAAAVPYTPQSLAVDLTRRELRTTTKTLITELIASNNQTASAESDLSGLDVDLPVTISAVSNGPVSSCSDQGYCAVAVAVAVGGTATARITAPSPCTGSVGTATAIAIAVANDARSQSARGVDGRCPDLGAGASSVSAVAGDTGAAYGVALASHGAASATTLSGHLGAVTAAADSDLPQPIAVAASGSTGDAAGIAIGQEGAISSVITGDSGHASASCARCSSRAGASQALTGDTGSSYGLAGAGLLATVRASTGDSGNADAKVTGTSVTSGSGNGARVIGSSGDTGNAIAVAVDLSTWVTVTTDSGDAGAVASVASSAGQTTPGPGSSVAPSTPSHQSVHRGPPAHHARPPALIAAVANARPLPAASPSDVRAVSPVVTVAPAPVAISKPTRTAESAISAGRRSAVSSNEVSQVLVSSAPELVPAAERASLTPRVGIGNGNSGLGLITLPFILLAAVCVAAVISHRSRRRRHW